jgi:hypothetical protein
VEDTAEAEEAEATTTTKAVVAVSHASRYTTDKFTLFWNQEGTREAEDIRDTVDTAADTEVSPPFYQLPLVLTSKPARSDTFHDRFEPLFQFSPVSLSHVRVGSLIAEKYTPRDSCVLLVPRLECITPLFSFTMSLLFSHVRL